MDNIDLSILKCLRENSRQTASTISQTINLSVSAVIERIRKSLRGKGRDSAVYGAAGREAAGQ